MASMTRESKLEKYEREQQERYPFLFDERYRKPGTMSALGMSHEVIVSKSLVTRSEKLNWCHYHTVGFYGVIKTKNNCWKFKFSDPRSAMFFKLTWGGL